MNEAYVPTSWIMRQVYQICLILISRPTIMTFALEGAWAKDQGPYTQW